LTATDKQYIYTYIYIGLLHIVTYTYKLTHKYTPHAGAAGIWIYIESLQGKSKFRF